MTGINNCKCCGEDMGYGKDNKEYRKGFCKRCYYEEDEKDCPRYDEQ